MDLKKLGSDELVLLRIAVEKELKTRSIPFSVGVIGEALAIEHFNSTPGLPNLSAAAIGTKNVDANSRNGERYSIKSVQKAKKTGTVYPDRQNPDKQLFEYLLIAKLDSDFSLIALYQFAWEEFVKVRAWDTRMNAWYVPLSKNKLDTGKCLFIKNIEGLL
jgi:hypothetical protein